MVGYLAFEQIKAYFSTDLTNLHIFRDGCQEERSLEGNGCQIDS